MHHALEIQEILSNIFQHNHSEADLASLARTCRAFNEPAMDLLWEDLNDLSVLVKCLPDASRTFASDNGPLWSFHRSLTQNEWDILHSRTRRIRTISLVFRRGLAPESFKMLAKPPMTETLFPNVRYLRCHSYDKGIAPLSRFCFPSLVSIQVARCESYLLGNLIESFSRTSPGLMRLYINGIANIDPSFLSQWQNLQIVECPQVCLDLTSLAHLPCMPALMKLSFTLVESLPNQMSHSGPPLVFPKLCHLQISSGSLNSLSLFLPRIRLATITKLIVHISCRPSKRDLASFFTCLQTSGMGHTIQDLDFVQNCTSPNMCPPPGDRPVLCMKDLEPCMAFSRLCSIHFDVEYQVDLTESDLFRLTSAWLHIEALFINPDWGWNSRGGLTPNGLLQFVQVNPSLTQMAIVIDTRGYTESPELSLGLTPMSMLRHINVVDSFIDAASVPAITAFFVTFKDPTVSLRHSWYRWPMQSSPHVDVCEALWVGVCGRVNSTATCPLE